MRRGLVLAAFLVLLALLMMTVGASVSKSPPLPTVHCLMVTGRDEARVRLARVAVANFLAQTHPRKGLIIVNEHPELTVLQGRVPPGVTEVRYDRSAPGASLGGMRNVSLDLVPAGDMWITWDDDDYRHETFLSALVDVALKSDADAVLHMRRLEHNITTGFTWGYERREGLWIVLATKKAGDGVRYRDLDANEDRDIRAQIKAAARRWCVWDNDPHVYIRTIHGRNTNTSVSPDKRALTGDGDFAVGDEDRRYVRDKLGPIRKQV